jgi:DNA-binding MarR family transcriptional regulator
MSPIEIRSTQLAAQLRPSILRLSRNLRRQANQQGSSSLDLQILLAINLEPGSTVAELAAIEQMTRPAMAEHIKRLVLRGYVHKAEANSEKPGSPIELALTRAGRTFLNGFTRRKSDWLADRLSRLSVQERSDLNRATKSLQLILEAARVQLNPLEN